MLPVLVNIKKFIPVKIKRLLKRTISREYMQLPRGRRAIIFLAADYGNIGDIAITIAQEEFLKKNAEGASVIRVPISRTESLIDSIVAQVTPEDIITIVGGGNMGSMYPEIERLRQLVIRSFRKNRVVCFPQTLDWDESRKSTRALLGIENVYSRHPDLHIFARETITRDRLEKLFARCPAVSIGLAPDIVLSARFSAMEGRKEGLPSGILLCFRDDRERALELDRRKEVEAVLARTGRSIQLTDTHVGGWQLDEASCGRLLAEKLNEFGTAELVVTDRLHGMILSIVAGTPCLVFSNANHKISQTWYDWLSKVPLVRWIDENRFSEMPEAIGALMTMPRGKARLPIIESFRYEGLRRAVNSYD
ncbi:hypothetical protein EIK56_19960 [Sphingomonas sp. C8-2]|jgi:pyruvyl transferase EpsI|nr:hypothetical protein EIK56_19960 [Sphingomonas sp. C8-2]